MNSLEVVINTESDVITVKRCTPNIFCLSTTYIIFSRLPTYKTNVSYKTYLWTKINSKTWSQTSFPLINRWTCCMSMVVMSIAKTTINESIYILRTYESVTSIWCNLERVTRFSLIFNWITFTPTDCGTNCPILIDIVTNLWKELISCNSIRTICLRRSNTYATTNITLCACCK